MDDRNIADASHFEVRAFGKDVLVYATGNGLLLIFGILQSLIIPKFLSVAGYGYWQLFILYGTYGGLLHFGFSDGLLMRWAGRNLDQIGGDLKTAVRFLVLEQLVINILFGAIAYFLFPPPLNWLGLMLFANALIQNLAYLLIFASQAVRQFRLLTLLSVARGLIFLLFIIFLYISDHLEYQSVILVFLASWLFFLLALAIRYRRYLFNDQTPLSALISFGKFNINTGILVLLGNYIFGIFYTLDGLLVSFFFPIEQFAVYAFAMAVSQMVFIFIRAIADVLFPHLSAAAPEQRTQAYQLGQSALIFCWGIALCAYFPLAEFIRFFLPNYSDSLPIIKILMGTMGLSSLIFILQVNYYRLYQKQRQYFGIGIAMLALAVILALIAIKVLGTLESVAIAILIGFLVWYIINEVILKAVTGESNCKIGKDIMSMLCYCAGFWLASFLNSWFIWQTLIYIVLFLAISFGYFRSDMTGLLSLAKKNRSKYV